jgi:GR25 family glycosyltransferase involved in LPS biosynthesis
MNKVDKIYYINLDRREDRREHFEKQCKITEIPMEKIQRYKAIDGSTYEFTTEELLMFSKCNYSHEAYAKKIMANQLSHYNILKDMIANQYEYIIILQDDVIFKNGFNKIIENVILSIPESAEIINIGLHQYALFSHFIAWDLTSVSDVESISKVLVNNEICVLKDDVNPCSLAYIVTLKGATNLVAYFDETGFLKATDWNFNEYLKNKNIFYSSNTILCTGNPDLGSDIF